MSPRRRSSRKRDWPANLYERSGYYSWRNPIDGRELGIGRDRAEAFAQANEANLHVAGVLQKPRLLDRLIGGDSPRTVGAWFDRYDELLERQHKAGELADNTLRSYKSLSRRARQMLKPDTNIHAVTALMCSEGLEAIAVQEGKARLAQALRNFLRDAFREARVQGWYLNENPILDTKLAVRPEVNRTRLTLETFRQIYAATDIEWLRNAEALAIVSGQRREDIALARFQDFHDGGWWLKQQKTGARLVIPLTLRVEILDLSLEEVLNRCRRTGVVSHYLIHQTLSRGNSPLGRRIWKDTISRRYSDVVESLGIDWGGKDPPTFHEHRSLAERLYAAQGNINTQELLGHRDEKSTRLYHDARGVEWVRVKVG